MIFVKRNDMKKKCAYCGRELSQDEIKNYYEDDSLCQRLVEEYLITPEEECPYCGYHNNKIDEKGGEFFYPTPW